MLDKERKTQHKIKVNMKKALKKMQHVSKGMTFISYDIISKFDHLNKYQQQQQIDGVKMK